MHDRPLLTRIRYRLGMSFAEIRRLDPLRRMLLLMLILIVGHNLYTLFYRHPAAVDVQPATDQALPQVPTQ